MLTFIFQIEHRRNLSFDSELPLRESLQPAGLLCRFEASLVSGQSLADGPSLLWAEVKGDVLLALERRENIELEL
jgi:hypothetical protein